MRPVHRTARTLFSVVWLLAATFARASEQVIDGGDAWACAQAVKASDSDAAALGRCDAALASEALTGRDRVATLVNRSVLRVLRKDLNGARADLDQAVGLLPDVGEIYFNRGAISLRQRRFDDALSDLNKALELGVMEPAKAYFNRALAYQHLGDLEGAYRDFQQAAVAAPDWNLPRNELARFKRTPAP